MCQWFIIQVIAYRIRDCITKLCITFQPAVFLGELETVTMVLTRGNFLYNHQPEQPVKPTFAHMLQLCLGDLVGGKKVEVSHIKHNINVINLFDMVQ